MRRIKTEHWKKLIPQTILSMRKFTSEEMLIPRQHKPHDIVNTLTALYGPCKSNAKSLWTIIIIVGKDKKA